MLKIRNNTTLMTTLPRRASTWKLSSLLTAKSTVDYDELVKTLIERLAHAPWAINLHTLQWLTKIAKDHDVSEALLCATIADADTKRRFSGQYDFERHHFEFFLNASAEEQRAASLRFL